MNRNNKYANLTPKNIHPAIDLQTLSQQSGSGVQYGNLKRTFSSNDSDSIKNTLTQYQKRISDPTSSNRAGQNSGLPKVISGSSDEMSTYKSPGNFASTLKTDPKLSLLGNELRRQDSASSSSNTCRGGTMTTNEKYVKRRKNSQFGFVTTL